MAILKFSSCQKFITFGILLIIIYAGLGSCRLFNLWNLWSDFRDFRVFRDFRDFRDRKTAFEAEIISWNILRKRVSPTFSSLRTATKYSIPDLTIFRHVSAMACRPHNYIKHQHSSIVRNEWPSPAVSLNKTLIGKKSEIWTCQTSQKTFKVSLQRKERSR